MKTGRLMVCVNRRHGSRSCAGSGSESLREQLARQLADKSIPLAVGSQHCFGRCERGPIVRLAPGGPFYEGVTEADLGRIVEEARAWLVE